MGRSSRGLLTFAHTKANVGPVEGVRGRGREGRHRHGQLVPLAIGSWERQVECKFVSVVLLGTWDVKQTNKV